MTEKVNLKKIVYGELLDSLQKVESTPLLGMTLAEAYRLGQLHKFIKSFVPAVFFQFVASNLCKRPYPVPEAPIAFWEDIHRELSMSGDMNIGWEYVRISALESLSSVTPKIWLDTLVSEYQELLKIGKEEYPNLRCIVLAPDWEEVKEIFIKHSPKKKKHSLMPTKKFIAEFRRHANAEAIEVLNFQGLLTKYEKIITEPSFREKWFEYQRKLYLDFMKRYPMITYSLCYDDYLEYRNNRNRAALDLLDGKYPEAVVMDCRALENVLRIYYFMKNMKEAPDKELGWLVKSMKNHITKELGEIYYRDLEFVLNLRPHAVHAKKKRKEITELKAQEVNDRIGGFCKTFFYMKWKIRF
ncbi:MAG: hypothetical protein E3J73_03370 [Candidatus Bathyarchaeum sp.]|nr:MAG: hypothetical protein E3J73_03370 [Candidatus Bathyarchaeum sp.]